MLICGVIVMKILEKGIGWSIEQRCTGRGNGDGGCNSLLLVEREDIYVTSSTDDYYYTFKCPVCNVETDIKSGEVPYSIQREKLEQYKVKKFGAYR